MPNDAVRSLLRDCWVHVFSVVLCQRVCSYTLQCEVEKLCDTLHLFIFCVYIQLMKNALNLVRVRARVVEAVHPVYMAAHGAMASV